jgi:hypothetical protein
VFRSYSIAILIAHEEKEMTEVAAVFSLGDIDGTNGFRVNGPVFSAADVNGDGFGDLLTAKGVLFRPSGGFSANVSIPVLNGSNGLGGHFSDPSPASPYSLSSIHKVTFGGDVNGDGFEDILIVSGRSTRVFEQTPGFAFVVYGKSSGFSADLDLFNVDGSNGTFVHSVADQVFSA